MKGEFSPEEKLLRLIKGEKMRQTEHVQPMAHPPVRKKSHFLVLRKYVHIPPVSAFDWVLPLALVVSVLFLFYGLFQGYVSPVLLRESLNAREISQDKGLVPLVKPVEDYVAMTSGKHIFLHALEKSNAGISVQAAVDEIQNISVIGIISGEIPQAVLEDKKNQKTYYLVQGQSFGNITVRRIESGKVVVSLHGKQYELYL